MTFNWYLLFNLTEFMQTGLVSRTLTVFLDGIGQKDILITRGNVISILYDDQFLPIQFADKNPYVRESETEGSPATAVYKDEDENVYVGIEVLT